MTEQNQTTVETLVDQSGIKMWQPKTIKDYIFENKRRATSILSATFLIFLLLILAIFASTTANTKTAENEKLSKTNSQLKSRNAELENQLSTQKEKALLYEEEASNTEICREAATLLAQELVNRNNIMVQILEGSTGQSVVDAIATSNEAFSRATLSLKICDPTISSSDLGL